MKNKNEKRKPVRNSTSGGHPTKRKISNGLNATRYVLYATLAGCLLFAAAGCENGGGKSTLTEEIDALKQEKKQLTSRIEKSRTENEQLRKQIQVLAGMKPEVKLEDIYELQKVRIHKYTNLYDKNEDGQYEKLIVYIQPIDADGDLIKAAGAVDVQLWDLNRENGEALLGQWRVEPNELKKIWFAALVSTNYRLSFDVADKIDKYDEPLTVKVTFTDYLTGKVFEEQKVIKP